MHDWQRSAWWAPGLTVMLSTTARRHDSCGRSPQRARGAEGEHEWLARGDRQEWNRRRSQTVGDEW